MQASTAVDTQRSQAGATRSHKALVSQVNARMDTALKAAADQAFAGAGIAPSEAIRALYARAASLGSSLTSVGDLVVGAVDDDARAARSAAFRRATCAFDDMLARYGFSVDVEEAVPMTETDVEEALYQDFLSGDVQ